MVEGGVSPGAAPVGQGGILTASSTRNRAERTLPRWCRTAQLSPRRTTLRASRGRLPSPPQRWFAACVRLGVKMKLRGG